MSEKPILFSAPMVRAILAGAKTQTRRIVKPQPDAWTGGTTLVKFTPDDQRLGRLGVAIRCPYGVPGDRLWVRETFAPAFNFGNATDHYHYRATYTNGGPFDDVTQWKPSIFMPRAASRITLEITDVRVERLQDISDGDCEAEGLAMLQGGIRSEFAVLWDSINAKRAPWASNPWVWALTFRPVTHPHTREG